MTAERTTGTLGGARCAAARWTLAALVASAPVVFAFATTPLAAQVAPVPAPTARAGGTPLVIVTTPLRVTDAGPGVSGRMLRGIVAGPHVALRGDSVHTVLLRRDTTFGTAVIVLGGDVAVAGHVRGDLVTIGGDIFVRPGARIDGRAIAYGGAVYPSALGIVVGGAFSYRDHTFVPTEGPTEIGLAYKDLEPYQVPVVAFPVYGLQIPEYTRVDGLAIGFGPTITIAEGGTEFLPTLTYRSHLGAIDPRVQATVRVGRRNRLVADIGRGTFSNDRWIRADILNSFTAFLAGTDTRNYFRADRAQARVERRFEGASTTLTPFVGARVERGWSTGPDSATTTRPFVIIGRDDRERVLRPNPSVVKGGITSALGGAELAWESPQRLVVSSALLVEQAFSGPTDAFGGFTQVTGHLELGFPTVRMQSFELAAHAVATAGDAPPQRWAYLGGNGTIQTMDLLEMGGDRLAYVESRYNIPIEWVKIPFAGSPVFTLRHVIGSAGVSRLPTFVQNVGIRLQVAVLRFDYTIDPANGKGGFDVSFAMPIGQ